MNDKLSGIKPGDRVRVTFEASVIDAGGVSEHPIKFRPDGASMDSLPGASILNQPTFHIERIEKPLAVGDRVRGVTSGDAGEIIWMNDTYVVIVGASHQHPLVKHISNVERLS